MIDICPLFSGSNGNSTYIKYRNTAILVDTGVSGKRIVDAINCIGRDPRNVAGILITHEHSDHIQSAGILSRRFNIPIYASEGTWEQLRPVIGNISDANVRVISHQKKFDIGEISVSPFSIPHDAAEPVGYNFFAASKKVTVSTDIGAMSDSLFLHLSGSDAILLESNHDIDMLRYGSYAQSLKDRILGRLGHLSNDEAAYTCARLLPSGTTHFILGHLSGDNNSPELAYRTAAKAIEQSGAKIGRDVSLEALQRSVPGRLTTI